MISKEIIFSFYKYLVLTLALVSYTNATLSSTDCVTVDLAAVKPIVENPELKFYLYTTNNYLDGQRIYTDDDLILGSSYFNINWPTRIFIHGWKGEHRSCVCGIIKDAYLENGNYNVIIVDWNDWSSRDFLPAVAALHEIGFHLKEFIIFLNSYGASSNNIYLIGHSLGAHLSGYTGSLLPQNKLNTIFGLDPTGPGFHGINISHRLHYSDANYVETIHTDMFFYGYGGALGHASFYPNYGKRIQPYCRSYPTDQLCSHVSSVKYFAQSINSSSRFCAAKTNFLHILLYKESQPDINCQYYMGGDPSVFKDGVFYVPVSSAGPYPA